MKKMSCFVGMLMMALMVNVSSVSSVVAQDDEVKAIIKKHIESMGGAEKLESVKSLVSKAVMVIPSPQGDMEAEIEQMQSGDKFLIVINIPQFGEMRQGGDGKHYWMTNPMVGAMLLDGDQAAMAREQYSKPFPAVTWLNYNGKIVNKGMEEVDGRSCHKLEFQPANGPKITRWFDAESGRMVKMAAVQSGPQGDMKIEVYPTDYRNVDGIMVPFKQVTSTPQGEMTIEIDSMEFNKEIDDATFKLPKELRDKVGGN